MAMNTLFRIGLILIAGLPARGIAQQTAPEPASKSLSPRPLPLREGYIINGCNGIMKKVPDQDRWIFLPDTEIIDGRTSHASEQAIELLPCSTLEKMTSAIESDMTVSLRLWARVLTYKNENFLYPIYFILTSAVSEPAQQTPIDTISSQAVPIPVEPNEPSIIPDNIRSLLKPKKIVNLTRMRTLLDVENDAILANRTGFVSSDPSFLFQPDGFGQNIDEMSFQLLRCSTLEATEKQLKSAGPGRQRYKIAGIVTKYKGKYYLFLQRATRTYTHGNFTQ
jgi:hypothetical protein